MPESPWPLVLRHHVEEAQLPCLRRCCREFAAALPVADAFSAAAKARCLHRMRQAGRGEAALRYLARLWPRGGEARTAWEMILREAVPPVEAAVAAFCAHAGPAAPVEAALRSGVNLRCRGCNAARTLAAPPACGCPPDPDGPALQSVNWVGLPRLRRLPDLSCVWLAPTEAPRVFVADNPALLAAPPLPRGCLAHVALMRCASLESLALDDCVLHVLTVSTCGRLRVIRGRNATVAAGLHVAGCGELRELRELRLRPGAQAFLSGCRLPDLDGLRWTRLRQLYVRDMPAMRQLQLAGEVVDLYLVELGCRQVSGELRVAGGTVMLADSRRLEDLGGLRLLYGGSPRSGAPMGGLIVKNNPQLRTLCRTDAAAQLVHMLLVHNPRLTRVHLDPVWVQHLALVGLRTLEELHATGTRVFSLRMEGCPRLLLDTGNVLAPNGYATLI